MTRSPPAVPPRAAKDLDAAASVLRERGLRFSAARRLVLQALFEAEAPVSAEDIAGGLGGRLPASDLASVYRNLETLEQLGLVRHVHLGHGAGRYRLASAQEQAYLVCERCDRVQTASAEGLEEVRAAVRRAFGYEAGFTHFPIVGVCPRCAGERARKA